MKTFKIVALQVIEKHKAVDIPLTDGLIINKENRDGVWIIEAYIEKQYLEIFQNKYAERTPFEIRVIITHTANDPAPFTAKIILINEFERHFSVLFEGKLNRRRNQYPELLLEDLIKEGFSGDHLMAEFKKRMKAKQP